MLFIFSIMLECVCLVFMLAKQSYCLSTHKHCKNVVYVAMYLTLWSANHTFIRVISTPTVPYNASLVWYAHFIFTVKASSWKYIMLASVISSAVTVQGGTYIMYVSNLTVLYKI